MSEHSSLFNNLHDLFITFYLDYRVFITWIIIFCCVACLFCIPQFNFKYLQSPIWPIVICKIFKKFIINTPEFWWPRYGVLFKTLTRNKFPVWLMISRRSWYRLWVRWFLYINLHTTKVSMWVLCMPTISQEY